MPVAVDEPNDRRIHGWRHVPGGREIGQWVYRREQAGDELSGKKTGVAAAHGEKVGRQGTGTNRHQGEDCEMRGRRGFWRATIALLIVPIPAWPQKHQVPAPQRDFTIFFGRDSTVISARDKAAIAQAAMNAKNLMGLRGRVDVRGYVDTSMSKAKSNALSERMAKAVRDELVRDGIDAEKVDYSGEGKTQLLKQTPDGVREPINCRGEIRIH
jgi:outer membrane protein OmpA-like peptidoglycan-associated protein